MKGLDSAKGKSGGKSKAGGGVVLTKKEKRMQTAMNPHVATLRAALFLENGADKDVTKGIAAPFLSYGKKGLDLSIAFRHKLSKRECEWAFGLTKRDMEAVYEQSGYGWDDEDKLRELSEDGARFLVVHDASDGGNNALVGFAHFRFTLQADPVDQLLGEPTLYLCDIHLEPKFRRRGLGKHLVTLLELVARRERMLHLALPVQLEDDETKEWIEHALKGFVCDDGSVALGELCGFDAQLEGFYVYSKQFPPPRAAAAAASPHTPAAKGNAATGESPTGIADPAAAALFAAGSSPAAPKKQPDISELVLECAQETMTSAGRWDVDVMLEMLTKRVQEELNRKPSKAEIAKWRTMMYAYAAAGLAGDAEDEAEDDDDDEDDADDAAGDDDAPVADGGDEAEVDSDSDALAAVTPAAEEEEEVGEEDGDDEPLSDKDSVELLVWDMLEEGVEEEHVEARALAQLTATYKERHAGEEPPAELAAAWREAAADARATA